MFHLADISNPTKPWHLCQHWADLLFIEFFQQGDLEKLHEFPVSQFFDRDTTNIAKSQIGFLDYIIKPSFELATKILPKIAFTIENVEANKQHWTALFEEYDEIKEKGNHIEDKIERKFAKVQTKSESRSLSISASHASISIEHIDR